MMDFVIRSFVLDFTAWVVLIALAGAGYVLVSQMLGDHGSAMIATTLLVLGAALGNRASAEFGLFSIGDKVLNMVAGMSAGMLAGAIVAIIMLWSWNAVMSR